MRTGACLFALTVALAASADSYAQSQPPQTYSITLKEGIGGAITTKVDRDGAKESVEKIVPQSEAAPGAHSRLLFDFAARRQWAIDLDSGLCSVVTYTTPYVSSAADPIGGVQETRDELAKSRPVLLRREVVNGIATKVYEIKDAQSNESRRLYLDERLDFVVKDVYIIDGKELTASQITSVSFARPPASLFVPPVNCTAMAGETTATGGHVETEISAAGAGQKDVRAEKDAPAGAVEIEIPGSGAVPAHYTGPAPAAFQFTFEVKASGPVQADWVLVSHGDTAWESGKLVFTAAGTKQLKIPVKIGTSNNQHWEGAGHLEVIVGEKRYSSPAIAVSADCKAK